MVKYESLVVDATTGDVKDILPLTFTSPIQFKMCDVGQFTAQFPVDHKAATHDNLEDGDREITVLRDDMPIFNGPFDWAVDSVSRLVTLTVYEASAYFDDYVIEDTQTLNEDRFAWVRDIWTYLTGKTSTTGDGTASPGLPINASMPNFSISSGLSGFTLDSSIEAMDLVTFRDVLNKLAESPDEGIEWCMDYTTGSSRLACQRTLVLGAPLGTTRTENLTDFNLNSYGRSGSSRQAGTRIHVRGQGVFVTKQNSGSISAGWRLKDRVYDRGTVSDTTLLADAAREFRRQVQPPVKVRSGAFTPNALLLPYGFCQLGDTVPFQVNDTAEMLDITAPNLRVVQLDLTVPQNGVQESVTPTFNTPLTSTGA